MKIPVLSYDALRGIANDFLSTRHPTFALPIPIEEIIDLKEGLAIQCQPFLQKVCGVDAFVNTNCDTIYVDAELYYSPNQNRYRFSLAHELAHVMLHRNIIAGFKFNTMPEWKASRAAISAEDNGWLEWQAHSLAGLLLVPDKLLAQSHKEFSDNVAAKWSGRSPDFIRAIVEQQLSQIFSVSAEVIQRRCAKNDLPA